MEISFHFESSVIPFVGKIAPSDTYKIWKRDGNLRADTSLAGFDGLKIQRADQSFLFLGDGDHVHDIPCGSLLVLNRDDKKIFDAFENAGAPMSDSDAVGFCSQTSVYRPGMDVTKAELVGRTNWRRQEKMENVGEWKARVYEVHNVVFSFRSRKVSTGGESDVAGSEQEKEYLKSLRPSVWLTEQFPLKTEELLPLLDILANKVKAVRRMRELLTTKFPAGTFPVKVAIPVVPTVRVVITFTKFVELQPVEQFFTPLSSPRHLHSAETDDDQQKPESHRFSFSSSSTWLRRSNSQSQLGSKQQQSLDKDPFAIPAGYTWTNNGDDRSRKMNKSKSVRKSK
ncbi:Ankyrin repeat domain-containing protein 13 [Sesbania bispinosa]|nr:Ankyrin repeat domain-containing protein 13 [Sesbania bispinosa]